MNVKNTLAVLLTAIAVMSVTGCGGDSVSGSGGCRMTELGYASVSAEYGEYYGEWLAEACTGGRAGFDCVGYDENAVIVRSVCEAEVKDPSVRECDVYYYMSDGRGGIRIYVDEGGRHTTDEYVGYLSSVESGWSLHRIDEVCR